MKTFPLRIGYVVREFPRLSETFILNEILELERQGVNVTIISLKRPPEEPLHPTVTLLRAPVIYLKDREPGDWLQSLLGAAPRRQTRNLWAALGRRIANAACGTVKEILRGAAAAALAHHHDLDALHAHYATVPATVAMHASDIAGIPFSFTAHAFDIFHKDVSESALAEKMQKARFVITVSDYNRRCLIERFGDLAAEKVRVLYNGIDLDYFSATTGHRETETILAVGRLVPKKGLADLIAACAVLKERGIEFGCCIVGEGPLESELAGLIVQNQLGDRISLEGALDQEAVCGLMQRAAIMCLPCCRDRDGNQDALPTVLLEALAAGLPIVASDLSGIPEIVTDGEEGFLVPAHDPVSLADALARLLTDLDLGHEMGKKGQVKAARLFNLHHNVRLLHDCLSASHDRQGQVT